MMLTLELIPARRAYIPEDVLLFRFASNRNTVNLIVLIHPSRGGRIRLEILHHHTDPMARPIRNVENPMSAATADIARFVAADIAAIATQSDAGPIPASAWVLLDAIRSDTTDPEICGTLDRIFAARNSLPQ